MEQVLVEASGVENSGSLLHDAFMDLSSVTLTNGDFRVTGFVVMPFGRIGLGKYRAELIVSGVLECELLDAANIDQMDIDEIVAVEGHLSIKGKMPVELRLKGGPWMVTAHVNERPFARRMPWGWVKRSES